MSEIKKVWLDSDAGIDDAFALLTGLKLKNIDIVGISAVCGNVEVDKTFNNLRNLLALADRKDIKVYKGASKPAIVPFRPAYNVHGEDGLGGAQIVKSDAPVETKNAVEALYEKAKELNGELIIVAVGPLTNVANAILKYPDFKKYVKEIDIMGGSVGVGGNANTAAEFNILGDPHSAQTVFKSGIDINMFGLDVTMKSVLTKAEVDEFISTGSEVAKFVSVASKAPMALYKMLGLGEIMCLHDSCPMLYVSDPTLFVGRRAGVYVETRAEISLGRTVSDIFVKADRMFEKNANVYLEVDRDRFAKTTLDALRQY